jgi:hypothetical protein
MNKKIKLFQFYFCLFQDLAYGLTDTSRLGCQVCMTMELSGMEVKVPEGVHDQRSA